MFELLSSIGYRHQQPSPNLLAAGREKDKLSRGLFTSEVAPGSEPVILSLFIINVQCTDYEPIIS